MTKRIVIIGGGIGGLMLASRLGRRYRRDRGADVFLVDRAPVHVWKPMLHTFAAGTAHARDDGVPFPAQARRATFNYVPGEFHAIDTDRKRIAVRIADLPNRPELQHDLAYDVAVVAVGAGANSFGVDGVEEHCHFIDTLWRAEALGRALREEIIFRSITEGEIGVAIVGGGATGVEFAAEVARLVEVGAAYAPAPFSLKLKITLLDTGDQILGGFPAEVADRVADTLRGLGVEIRCNARVARATPEGFELADGTRVDAAVRVWAAGVKAHDAAAGADRFARARSGQIIVTPTLQTTDGAYTFAMGDCASLTPAGGERPLPPTGQVARQQADYLAAAIPKHLNGQELKPFRYRDMGSLVSLSQYGAYGSLAGKGPLPTIVLRGWIAKRAHALFYRMHQFGLFGPVRGLAVMLRDALNGLIRPPIRLD